MNYKSQLNGWAVEMIIKAKAAGYKLDESLDNLIADTQKLVDYAYTPRKDFDDHMEYFFNMVRNSPAGEANIAALIGTLEHIQSDRYAQRIDILESAKEGLQ